jgi:hypothetical protein
MKIISDQHPDDMIQLDGSRQGKGFTAQAKVSQRPASVTTDEAAP